MSKSRVRLSAFGNKDNSAEIVVELVVKEFEGST